MMNFSTGWFFTMLCCAVVVMCFASCEKEPIGSLIPPDFDGKAIYTMNGEMRTSLARISDYSLLACHINLSFSDFSLGQPQAILLIDRLELCESVGDTLQVTTVDDQNRQEPGPPIGRYTVLNGGDLLAARYSPAESSTIEDNYVVITAYDEASGLVRASFKLDFKKGFGNEDEFPPTLAIEGELEAIL